MSVMREIKLPQRHSVADVELAERVAAAMNSASLCVFASIPGPAPAAAPAHPRPVPTPGDLAIAAAEALLIGVARVLRGVLRV